jgi:hypothetical protein
VTEAQTDLYTSRSPGSLEAVQRELRSLGDDLPRRIQVALGELVDGFAAAGRLLTNPTKAHKAGLARLQSELAGDAQAVSTYIVTQCPAGD